jgi:UDP-glucose 4-epimerase
LAFAEPLMRVLITGAFGHVGGRLAQFLAEGKDNQIVLGTRTPVPAPHWLPQAEVVQTDWASPDRLNRICANADAVVHLSGMNAQECAADPVGALEVNGLNTARLVTAAGRQRVQRFIYVSTAQVYRMPLAGVVTEATCPTSCHAYATSHRAGEDVVRLARVRGELDGCVIRLSNSYGAPAHKSANCWMLLMNDLCYQAVTTRRMALKSSGLQRRDFVPLADVCRAIEHLLTLPGSGSSDDTVNVGGQWTPTVWEVASLIQARCKAVLGFEPQLTRTSPGTDETSDDLEYRIDALLRSGFEPTADKTGEIDRLLEFCNSSFSAS